MSVQQHMVAVNGGTLALVQSGSGVPLICIHGWTLNKDMWRPQLALAGRGLSLAVYDRRGFGQSTATADLTREIDDINAIKTYFGFNQVALFGMSQGARIAMHYAVQHSDAVSHLILQSTPADETLFPADADSLIPYSYYAQLIRDGQLPLMRAQWADHPVMACHDHEVQSQVEKMLKTYQGLDLIGDKPGLGTAKLENIKCPTLIICGSDEPEHLVSYSRNMAQKISDARLLCLVGEGHFANMTAAQTVNDAIETFLLSRPKQLASAG
jgi:pimeloyl-ACP methyl ester carboxylesterase